VVPSNAAALGIGINDGSPWRWSSEDTEFSTCVSDIADIASARLRRYPAQILQVTLAAGEQRSVEVYDDLDGRFSAPSDEASRAGEDRDRAQAIAREMAGRLLVLAAERTLGPVVVIHHDRRDLGTALD
jgi:hypothetical protein